MKKLIFLSLLVFPFIIHSQVTTGYFGGNKTLDGVVEPNVGHTTNKWIRLAELTINGSYSPAGITVDFFPKNSNHGDSRQQLNVQFRNNGGTAIENTYDITLIDFYGEQKTIKNAKVIQTSGSGVNNNKLSVWVQIGISWLSNVPIEVRTYGSVTFKTTNQPCFTSITETGTVYDLRSNYTIAKNDGGNQYFTGDFVEGDGKEMFRYSDSWLRINEDKDFTSGIYCGSGILRTDGRFEVGPTGNKFLIGTNGNVGIGTTTPDQKLTVQGNVNIGGTGNAVLRLRHIEGKHYQNANYDNLHINYVSGKDVVVGNFGNENIRKSNLLITGNVGIGTTSPSEKLSVNGNIRAKEVKVELENWPDYVFDSAYKLPSLQSVKAYISQNGHLPNIPNAATVIAEGIDLGDMNAKLLQKIEELTLYTLSQEEKLQTQQEIIASLSARLSQIESQINLHENTTP